MITLPLFDSPCQRADYAQLSIDRPRDQHLLLFHTKGTTLSIISRAPLDREDHMMFMELSFINDDDHFLQAAEILKLAHLPASETGKAFIRQCAMTQQQQPIQRIAMLQQDRQTLVVARPTYSIIESQFNGENRITIRFLLDHVTLFQIQEEWLWLLEGLLRKRISFDPSVSDAWLQRHDAIIKSTLPHF